MLTRSEIDDLDTCLLKQCPGPPECTCRFCKTRHVLAAYSRVVALADEMDARSEDHYMYSVAAGMLRRAMEG
jgi:hypothetical protein